MKNFAVGKPSVKITIRRLTSNSISKEWPTIGVTVLVEVGVLGHTFMHIGVEYDDLKLLMTNGWLDQNIIAWYLADLHMMVSQNSRNKCAFITLGAINALEIGWDDICVTNTILATMMHKKEKEFFFGTILTGAPLVATNH
ncbi:hypothetical protein L6452_28389 [Arctium lappa]|uniref:Uncharacterized protein n=1 Tax=Arctium lappa TaxID=4217 RepID=A0ACB8ZZB2_ARCLA|nr:hypothetical protein L6452_28389 [Arctium lappa]